MTAYITYIIHNFEMKPSLALKLFKGVGSSAERGRLESERETAVCFLHTNVSNSSAMRMNHVKQKCIYKDCDEGSFHFLTLAILPQGRLWDKSWPSSWKPENPTCGLLLLPIIGLLPFNPVIHDGSHILNRSCWCNIIMWQNVFNWHSLPWRFIWMLLEHFKTMSS